MISFNIDSIYRIHSDGHAMYVPSKKRTIATSPDSFAPVSTHEARSRPFVVDGVNVGEFAVFATIRDTNASVTPTVPYIVLDHCNEEQSVIADADLVEKAPRLYITRHLANVLLALDSDDLRDFNIPIIASAAKLKYPDIKSLD